MKNVIFFLLFFLSLISASAHVVLVYPEGGEKFYSNDTVTISWQIAQAHDQFGWNLYYSSNGGEDWTTVVAGLPVSQLEYKWLVPTIDTEKARIRVVQSNKGLDYDDISANFTIESITGIRTKADIHLFESFVIAPNPVSSNTYFKFSTEKPQQVSFYVYSLNGELIKEITGATYFVGLNKKALNSFGLKPGSYIVVVRTETASQSYKMLKLQ